jgi:CubicO group peptidase (beta-lactamase class C family)
MDLAGRLDAVIDSAVADEKIVGSVTLVARHGELVFARAAGWFDREAGTPMRRDAIFRLASVTKPVIASAALAMIERGLLGLDNAVADYLPYFRPRNPDGSEARILIRHLLSHTSGLGYGFRNPAITTGLQQTDLDHEANLRLIAEEPLLFAPGTGWEYGVSIDVLGAILAGIVGGTLEDAANRYVTGPLRMTDTAFHVRDRDRLAVPYADGPPGLRRMGDPDTITRPDGSQTTFAPSRIFNAKAFQSGGAGMAGTADDILKLLESIRIGGGEILRPDTIALAASNQVGDLPLRPQDAGLRFGFLSAIVDDPVAANSPAARGTLRWGGVYGHDWSVDPASGITILSMTNTPYEGCNGQYRYDIRDAVYGRTGGQ